MPPNIAQPSLGSLFIEMRYAGQTLATGTGFVTHARSGRKVLVTNRHNVTGRDQNSGELISKLGAIPNEVAISHHATKVVGTWVTSIEPLLDSQQRPLWLEHPTLRERADFVALPLTTVDSIQVYTWAPENPGLIAVAPADPVSVIGFPFGIKVGGSLPVWATGFVASDLDIDFQGLPTFLVDCRTREGQSGSPVVAYRTTMYTTTTNSFVANGQPGMRFMGIYSGRVNRESDLGIVWKASAIAELLYAA